MKYFFQSISVSFLIFSVSVTGTALASHQFPDVSTNNKYHLGIDYLVDAGVIAGYPDGTFKPNNSVNRVEALKIIYGSFGVTESVLPDPSAGDNGGFSDTLAGQWYMRFLLRAKDEGVVAGYPDGTFKPTAQVNLAEALKMLLEKSDLDIPVLQTGVNLPSDVPASEWFAKYVSLGLSLNLIEKNSSGNVSPGTGLSRGALSEIAFRFRYMKDNNLSDFRIVHPTGNGVLLEGGILDLTEQTDEFIEVTGVISKLNAQDNTFLFGTSERGFITVRFYPEGESAPEGVSGFFNTVSAGSTMNIMGQFDVSTKTLLALSLNEIIDLAGPYTVGIEDFAFLPANITIRKGSKVRFTNLSSTPHEVATDPHPQHTQIPEFVSDILQKNDSYEFTFPNAGTYTFHCHLHPSMKGTITVTD